MNIIYILVPLSVLLLALAIGAFFWAVRNDQFEDLDSPALDVLDDDDQPVSEWQKEKTEELTNRKDAKSAKD